MAGITPSKFIEDYLKYIGLTGHTQSLDLRERINSIYKETIFQHLCTHDWSFLQTAEVSLSPTGTPVNNYIDLETLIFIKGARVSTANIIDINDLHPIKFDFYQRLRSQGGIGASDNPQFLARRGTRLYPYPIPKSTSLIITVDGVIDYDERLPASYAQIYNIPKRHQQALFRLFDYNLGMKGYDEYQIEMGRLIGGEPEVLIDWWGEPYGVN